MTSTGREPAYRPISEAAGLIKKKEVSPLELTALMLSRIEELNPTLNAY